MGQFFRSLNCFPLALLIACLPGHVLAQDEGGLQALSLRRAEQLLESGNPELRLARRQVEAAGAGTVMAGARPNPNLSLGIAGINPQAGVGGGSLRDKTVDSSVRIDQLIERGDKRELRIASARNLESAIVEDFSDVFRQQRLALRSAYYDLMLAQDKTGIAQDNAALIEQSLRASDLRLKAGDVSAADVSRVRVDALRAQNDVRVAQAERRRAQVALAYLIGADAQSDRVRAVENWPGPVTGVTLDVTDDVLDRRPDVRAARSRVEAAQSGRDLAHSLRKRDIVVGLSYDRYPLGTGSNTFGTGNSFGVFVSMPLFARYHFEGEIQRAEVDYNAALDSLDKTRAQARAELSRTASDLAAAADRLRRYDESLLIEARRSADSSEFAYKSGAIGVMDLLDSRRTLRAIQMDAATARADYAKALSAWQAGIGAAE